MVAKAEKWLKIKNLEKITQWASDRENTITVIAQKMGIHSATFYRWLKSYSESRAAFEQGRKVIDEGVECSFFKTCTGHKETVQKTLKLRHRKWNKDGNCIKDTEKFVSVPEEVYMPPNVNAAIFYLCNRMPDKWKARGSVAEAQEREQATAGVVVMPEMSESDTAADKTEGADKSGRE